MRHRIKVKKLNRSTKQRKALFRGLIVSLVKHEEIETTQAKAKAVRGILDKLITKSKTKSLHARRLIQGMIQDSDATNKLVDDLGVRYKETNGGYTRILKIASRKGDNAPMVLLSLTKKKKDQDKPKTFKKSTKSKSTPKTAKAKAFKLKLPQKLTKPKSTSVSSIQKPQKQGER